MLFLLPHVYAKRLFDDYAMIILFINIIVKKFLQIHISFFPPFKTQKSGSFANSKRNSYVPHK